MNMTQPFRLLSPEIKGHCLAFIGNLPTDDKWVVTIDENNQTRSDSQNSLLWHWNGEVAHQLETEKSPSSVHAKTKLYELLGLYLSWGGKYAFQGAVAKEAIDRCLNTQTHDKEDIQAYIADRMLRTKGKHLGVKRFAEYLNAYESYWTPKGVRLTTADDLYFQAMGRKAA